MLLAIGLIVARALGYGVMSEDGVPAQRFVWAVFNKHIALISGHAGNDSGATCEDADGTVTLKEADVVAEVAQRVGKRLTQAGASVTILEEFDPRLDNLEVDTLLSIHADSCIDNSGFKVAHSSSSQISEIDDRLVACLEDTYHTATKLATNPDTITHNMTEYHAWQKIAPTTPAAIIEIGFLGGDQELLTKHRAWAAKGISDGILCFLTNQPTSQP
ncbi:MAG: N-acetylmuramoyl-L-alanine amidase [Caldilineaceae bacterium]